MKFELTLPNYEHCILNTITSILKYYKVNTPHSTLPSLDSILNSHKYKNIVFLVLDGLGEHIYKPITNNGFFSRYQLETLTSVFPSTTTAALTTYYSGKPPYETGWIAWSQYFKEYGRSIDMLKHTESYKNDSLNGSKIDVFQSVVNYETIFNQIENASTINAYEITPSYSDKRSKRSLTADNIDELIDHIKLLCNNPEEKFVFAYCDEPDHSLHKYGTNSAEVQELILSFENKIEYLSESLPNDTLLIISADHGHLNIEDSHSILDYPELQECMYMPASLESRALTFWIKEDKKQVFEERFNRLFKGKFLLISKAEFLEKNFLGFGTKHSKIDDFLGNYVAISISSSIIRLETYLAEGKPIKKSTHCGLTKNEMEVPLIIYSK